MSAVLPVAEFPTTVSLKSVVMTLSSRARCGKLEQSSSDRDLVANAIYNDIGEQE